MRVRWFDPVAPAVPYRARVTVRAFLRRHRLSAYRVATHGLRTGTLHPDTAYRFLRGDSQRLDLGTLAALAGLLHALTGERVTLEDLLDLAPIAETTS